jgi:hypothetical protein
MEPAYRFVSCAVRETLMPNFADLPRRCAALAAILPALAATLFPAPAKAFWLLGFSTADTLPPGAVGAIAGTGGQYSRVGSPASSSFTPFLAHAGFRLGIADGFDIGYRLVQVPLPFSSVGPSLGSEIDGRLRLTAPQAPWQAAVVAGVAYSYLELSGVSKNAWSPGADLMMSHAVSQRVTFISELRYVYTEITDAPGGAVGNHLYAAGGDIGAKITLTPSISLIPEVGLFDFSGSLRSRSANGFGAQYGAVLSFRL